MKLAHRQDTVFAAISSGSATPQFGQTYTVRVFSVGGRAAAASSGTEITLDAGHSFQSGDKALINPGTSQQITAAINSTTATTITFSSETYSIAIGDVLVNLGPDTGTDSPNYDASKVKIYSDPDGGTELSGASVTTSDTGSFEYFHKGSGKMWEVVFDSSGVAQAVNEGFGGISNEYSVMDYGAEVDPDQGINAAITAAGVAGGLVTLPSDTLTLTAGDQIAISGDDVTLQGVGDSSLISATGSTTTSPINVTGDRCILRNFKIIGNRGQASQSTAILINGVSGGLVDGVFVDEGGAGGIHVGTSSTNVRIVGCRVDSSRNHGILFQSGANNCTAEANYLSDCCQAGTNTLGSLSVIGGSPNTNSISLINNVIYNSQANGIRVEAASGVNPEDVRVIGNEIDTTGNSLEGISMSANRGTCVGNIVKSSAVSGILVYGAATGVSVTGNVIHNSGQTTGDAAIRVRPDSGAMGIVTVVGNVAVDTQTTATQGRVCRVGGSGDSGSLVACIVDGNVGSGNTNSDPVDIGDTDLRANCFFGMNSEESRVDKGTTETGITASTTQSQGNGVLTSDFNIISTVANANDAVTLPSCSPGRRVLVANTAATNACLVFPASGDQINNESVDAQITLSADDVAIFFGRDATTWTCVVDDLV